MILSQWDKVFVMHAWMPNLCKGRYNVYELNILQTPVGTASSVIFIFVNFNILTFAKTMYM